MFRYCRFINRIRLCIFKKWIRPWVFQINQTSHKIIWFYVAQIWIAPCPFHFRDEEEKCIQDMLDAGVIQPSCSDWASPVCLVRKRCGGVRVTTDYRALNRVSIKDAYPLPRIHYCLDTLSGNKWFSNNDMASGYYQVAVENSYRYLTAFITKYGLFEYVCLPFGLSYAPAMFQRIVNLVFSLDYYGENA